MKVIKIGKIKLLLFLAFISITLVIFLAFFKYSRQRHPQEIEELVLEMAPEDILSPSIFFKKTSNRDLEYRIDESGSLIFRDKDGKMYTIDANGNVYEIKDNGQKIRADDAKIKNSILLSSLEESKEIPYLASLINGNEVTILKEIDPSILSQSEKKRIEKIVKNKMNDKRNTLLEAYSDILKGASTPISANELLSLLDEAKISSEEFLHLVDELGIDGAIKYLKEKASLPQEKISTLGKKTNKNEEKKSFVFSVPNTGKNIGNTDRTNASQNTERNEGSSMFSSSEALAALKESNKSSYEAQNGQNSKLNFLKNEQSIQSTEANEYSITPGTIIPLTLITSINTDLPGNVLAQVSSNILDSVSGENVLIEKGEKLTGRYDSSISYAQNRVQVVWDTLIKNNGKIVPLSGVIGIDEEGKSGYVGTTNRHLLGTIGASGTSLLLNVGTSALSDITSSSLINSLINGMTNTAGSVASSFISKELDRQPTIIIEKGTKINAFVNSTIQMFSDML